MKKGFTLIELLAVIVILAVIALIATPMILNVIETAREGAAISSANGYLEALENYQVMSEFKNEEKFTGTVQVSEINSKISVKGDMPKSGTVTITDNKIVDYNLHFSDYTVTYDETTNKAVAIKGEVEYAIGTEVTIDGVAYYVIKTSYKDDETVTLLSYDSIGDLPFDENGGTYFETSTLKTYLNTTYKDTFGDKKSMIVGDITLLDFGTWVSEEKNGGKQGDNIVIRQLPISINGGEGTYAYLYNNGYGNILRGSDDAYRPQFWTKTTYGDSLIIGASYSDSCPAYDENGEHIGNVEKGYFFDVASFSSLNNNYSNCSTGCAFACVGLTGFEGFPTRPVITIKKEALN